VYHGSESRLPAGEGSDATACPTAPDPASLPRGLRRCHASFGSLWATGLKHKKKLAGLFMQLGSHVSKAPDVIAIMGLQDVWAGGVINTCKTCGHVATVQL
jgi:hypothetical protein